MNLPEEELVEFAKFCGDESVNAEVREVLITGGDPLMVPGRLGILLDAIVDHAPNIRIIRIGSRVPAQDPERVNDKVLDVLRPRPGVRIEIATQINHASELFPEVKEAYGRIRGAGVTIYDQTVLLKGLNDNISALSELVDGLRYIGIETHYLFHCIPMRGMAHHRTSIEKGLQLIRRLTSSGLISGRCKPMFTAMTDIGKITFYDGVIVDRNDNKVLL
jgi:lysine 2,3-aminomutase